MSEHIGSDSDSDDSGEKSSSTAERAPAAREVGEILLGRDAAADTAKPETIFTRHDAAAEKAAAAAHFSLMAELNSETDDDDDDETESDERKSEATTVETVDEAEAPDDHLSQAEIKTVVEAYDADRSSELAAERADVSADSVEAASVAANELFIDKVDEKLTDPDTTVEAALDEAAAETEQAIDEAEAVTGEAATANSAASEAETNPAEDAEDEADTTTTAGPVPGSGSSGSGSGGGGAGGRGGSGGSGGGGTPPPFGSTPPPGPSPYGGGPTGPGFGPTTPAASFNTARPGPVITPEDLAAARRHGETSGLVIGGILGYLIGRRRGRIKTEKRLLPIQDKLEKQVDGLHQSVANKEQDIRRLAAEKFRLSEEAQRRAAIERLQPEPKPPKPLPFERYTNQAAAEALPLPVIIPAAELLTGIDTDRESGDEIYRSATTGQTVEIFKREAASLPQRHIEQVERLSTKEMLELSERVVIGGARLRDIYEGKQITEPGLKHILTEFLSGGDVKRALDQELLVKQMGYERDPKLRRTLSAGYGSSSRAAAGGDGSSGTAASSKNTNKPGSATKAKRSGEQSDIPNEAEAHAKRMERVIVSGWVTLVTILVIIVFWLLVRRG